LKEGCIFDDLKKKNGVFIRKGEGINLTYLLGKKKSYFSDMMPQERGTGEGGEGILARLQGGEIYSHTRRKGGKRGRQSHFPSRKGKKKTASHTKPGEGSIYLNLSDLSLDQIGRGAVKRWRKNGVAHLGESPPPSERYAVLEFEWKGKKGFQNAERNRSVGRKT